MLLLWQLSGKEENFLKKVQKILRKCFTMPRVVSLEEYNGGIEIFQGLNPLAEIGGAYEAGIGKVGYEDDSAFEAG